MPFLSAAECLFLRTSGPGAWTCPRCRSSLTTTCPTTESCTYTGTRCRLHGLPRGLGSCPLVSAVLTEGIPLSQRIGRSGRYGRKGVAINFVKNDDIRILRDIEQYYSTQIDEMPMNGERRALVPGWGPRGVLLVCLSLRSLL